MKNRILIPFVLFLALSFTSCKKEKAPDVIGNWYSIAQYRVESGSFTWQPINRFSQFITFYPDARFNTFNCTPTGGGTYSYNNRIAKIELNYEADHYGNAARTVSYTIEELADNSLILASYSATGNLQFKTEYIRND